MTDPDDDLIERMAIAACGLEIPSWPDREPVRLSIDNAAALTLATRGTIALDGGE